MNPQSSTKPAATRLSLPLWNETYAAPPLPMTAAEMAARGWEHVDIVFVTGDAYVDHPSFAMAILGRVLEAAGFRVAMLSQPDWHSCFPWRQFGRPRQFFAEHNFGIAAHPLVQRGRINFAKIDGHLQIAIVKIGKVRDCAMQSALHPGARRS